MGAKMVALAGLVIAMMPAAAHAASLGPADYCAKTGGFGIVFGTPESAITQTVDGKPVIVANAPQEWPPFQANYVAFTPYGRKLHTIRGVAEFPTAFGAHQMFEEIDSGLRTRGWSAGGLPDTNSFTYYSDTDAAGGLKIGGARIDGKVSGKTVSLTCNSLDLQWAGAKERPGPQPETAPRPTPPDLVAAAIPPASDCDDRRRAAAIVGRQDDIVSSIFVNNLLGRQYIDDIVAWKTGQIAKAGHWLEPEQDAFRLKVFADPVFLRIVTRYAAGNQKVLDTLDRFSRAEQARDRGEQCRATIDALAAMGDVYKATAEEWAFVAAAYDARATAMGIAIE